MNLSLFQRSLSLVAFVWTTTATRALEVTTTPPLLSVPTYSLATVGPDGKTNMNILTYATPISIQPDRLWAIGLYKGTLTYDNFVRDKKGILQLLTNEHAPIVRLLGGTSGNDIDKDEECSKLGFEWTGLGNGKQPHVLKKCASYLCLELLQDKLVDGGSHDIAICRVTSMHKDGLNEDQLSTQKLRELGIITKQGRVAE